LENSELYSVNNGIPIHPDEIKSAFLFHVLKGCSASSRLLLSRTLVQFIVLYM